MKKILLIPIIAFLGLLLIGTSSFLKGKGESFIYLAEKIDKNCKLYNSDCSFIYSILGELHNVGSGIKRKTISKDTLPIVRIYMNDGSISKLDDKRNSVLSKLRPIHISEDDDWVKAKIQI